jgi:hypothetical protein
MGSSGQPPLTADALRTASSARGGSRAFWPGSGRRRRIVVAGLAVLLIAVAAGVISLTRGSSAPQLKYGLIPDWLPKPTVPVGRIVQASAAHRWLAIEGDTVSVRLARGRVMATVVGPALPSNIPQAAQEDDVETSPGTFTVTLASASGVVPLGAHAFTIIENGHILRARVSGIGGRPLPARVTPGGPVTLTLKAVLPEGDGSVRWAPAGGAPIVAWEFHVELD